MEAAVFMGALLAPLWFLEGVWVWGTISVFLMETLCPKCLGGNIAGAGCIAILVFSGIVGAAVALLSADIFTQIVGSALEALYAALTRFMDWVQGVQRYF